MATQLVTAYAELGLFIGGEWLGAEGRKTSPVINPATEETIGQVPHASKADLDRALAAAQLGFKTWRAIFPDERGRILKRAADLLRERKEEIARIATTECGKSIHETRIEVMMSANIFEWYAEEGRRAYGRVLPQRATGTRMAIVKEPVGPVAAFAPWNFPLGNPARKIGSALGAGCSVILKPAEEAPASGLAVARCLVDAGLPANVLAIVYGVPAEISSYLLASPLIRAISFTGSIPVGKHLMKLAADGMKRTTMELGGHAPVIVFDDVDLEKVLDASLAAKYRNAGQVCVSPTRYSSTRRFTASSSKDSRRGRSRCRWAMGSTRKTRWGRWCTRGGGGDRRIHPGRAGARRRVQTGGRGFAAQDIFTRRRSFRMCRIRRGS